MEPGSDREQIVEKMFDAGLKEKFSQLARKYDHNLVFEFWTQIVKSGGAKNYFSKWEWKPETTIGQALDCLDGYCDSIEAMIRDRQEERGGKG
ncbi:MAG: hypothetical protein ABSB32_06420 [Thermodesulfobacteriota bacterium]